MDLRSIPGVGLLSTVKDQLSACFNPDTGPLQPQLAGANLPVSEDRLRQDVDQLVAASPRDYKHPENLNRSADYIRQNLAAAGARLQPPNEHNTFEFHGKTYQNVVAQFGSQEPDAPVVVIGAHYDSYLGATGANDNGSGVAVLLELARHAQALADENPNVRFDFVAYTLEECSYARKEGEPDLASVPPRDDHGDTCGNDYFDLEGSRRHARHLAEQGANVKAVIVLETVGNFQTEPGTQRYPEPFNSVIQSDRLCGSTGNFLSILSNHESKPLLDIFDDAFENVTSLDTRVTAGSQRAFPDFFRSDHKHYIAFFPESQEAMVTDGAPYRNAPGKEPTYHRHTDMPGEINFPRVVDVVKGVYQGLSVVAKGAGAT